MIAYYSKRTRRESFEKIQRPLNDNVWIDGQSLEHAELQDLTLHYELDENIVSDVMDQQELPRIEFSDRNAYVFLRVPHLNTSGHVLAHPLLVVVHTRWFMTLSTKELLSPASISNRHSIKTTEHPKDLLLLVIAACVDSYSELLQRTERSVLQTASRLRTHEIESKDFIHFVTVEDNLTTFRMNLNGLLAVSERIKNSARLDLATEGKESIDDTILHIQQLLAAVDTYSAKVKSIRNAHATIANNTLNKRMKTLTVFTVLITLPNVFYGMYGMNVALPFSEAPWAYGVIVSFTVLLLVFVYMVARKLKIF